MNPSRPDAALGGRRRGRRTPERGMAACLQRTCLGVWLLLSPALASNAAAQHLFESWTTENGLPQNSVNDILQTRDGYLWLATHGGLTRFDGVRFVVFDRSVPGVESQRIRALHEDRQGNLWAATEDGMLIRYRDGAFTTYSTKDGLPHDVAVRIEEDQAGALWVTWVGGRITSFDGRQFVTLTPDDFTPRVVPPPEDGYLDRWWSRSAAGVHVLVKGRVLTIDLGQEASPADVTGVGDDRLGNLWIRTAGRGVIKVSGGRLERLTTRDGLPTDSPLGMFSDDCDGGIWFFDRRQLQLYRIRNGRTERIDAPGFRAFFVDREGSTWLGTSNRGLHRFRDAAITMYSTRDGLSNNSIYSILEDRSGVLWIGTWDGGLHRSIDGRLTPFTPAGGLPSNRITCLYEDAAGRLWIGLHGKGIGYLDKGEFRRFRDPYGFLDSNVWAVIEDRTGTFWFATDAGLVELEGKRFTRYTTRHGLPDDRITALFEAGTGALWIGAQRGLSRLHGDDLSVITERDGFVGNQVRAFHEDKDGILWVGTYDGGLYRIRNGRLTRYTRREGLHDNGIFQILEDAEGHFWMGSNRGIQRVSRRELNELAEGQRHSVSAVVFGTKDGLAGMEVNGGRQPPGLKRADGKLWFPTMEGIAVIDPAAFRIDVPPPAPRVEEVRLAGTPVSFSSVVRVPSTVSAFDLRYTAPTFIKADQIKFRYRLVGLDRDWIDAGEQRVASFYRIPPGEYTFVVTASNLRGEWHPEGARLVIVVAPPFWRTWWFAGASCAVLLGALAAAHERRIRRLRTEHANQLAFSRRLIESQESERRRISNEMHDSLGQHITIIRKRAQKAGELIDDRQRVSVELEEIGQLAEQIRVEMKEIASDLRPYHLDKIGLTKTIEKMADRVGRACGLEMSADITPIDDAVSAGRQIHVYRIVQEAVSNVVNHANASRVKVTVTRDDTWIHIQVEDNGKGLLPGASVAGVPASEGMGLMGIRERTRILGGTVEIRSDREGMALVLALPLEGLRDGH